MQTKLYLAYGSNLNIEKMAYRCPTAKVVGTTVLEGYQLLFRGSYGSAVATIEPRTEGRVPVVLWEITTADEASLDHYEGWPFLYRKENLDVRLEEKTISAMVYIMNEGKPSGLPSCYYYSTILQGYITHGFDVELLRKAVKESTEDEDDNRQNCSANTDYT